MRRSGIDNWRQVWEERGSSYPSDDPIAIDGFDHAAGKMNEATVDHICKTITKQLNLEKSDRLLEVGCGVGMMLSRLANYAGLVVGTDYAMGMVQRGQNLFPHLLFLKADSNSLPFPDRSFTKVLLHSVTQYFSGYDYCESVIKEFLRVTGNQGKSLILLSDVVDLDKKEEYLAFREEMSTSVSDAPAWRSSVKETLHHQFYSRSFFQEIAARHHLSLTIMDREIPDYPNAAYRYDVLLQPDTP